MNHEEFIKRVVEEGIKAAQRDYCRPDQKDKRDGSIAGFKACIGKSIDELKELLESCAIATEDARKRKADDYWWFRCYEAEVSWLCNCLSVVLMNEGLPVIVPPTARAAMLVATIIGVKK